MYRLRDLYVTRYQVTPDESVEATLREFGRAAGLESDAGREA